MKFRVIERVVRKASPGRRTLIAMIAIGGLGAASTPAEAAPTSGPTAIGARLSVEVVGRGPDVVLLPGLASSRAVWAATVARLRPHYRLHLVQIAGFAGEPALANGSGEVLAPIVAELEAYLSSQATVRPAIVGHSMGGLIALMLASRSPGSVGHVVVVDALPFFELLYGSDATLARAGPRAEAFRDRLLDSGPAGFRSGQKAAISRLVLRPGARAAALGWSLTSDRRVVAQAVYEVMTTDLRPELSKVAAPVDVIFAYDAPFGPVERIDRLFRSAYANAPAACFHRVDKARHFVMLDRPVRFGRLLESLLATPSC